MGRGSIARLHEAVSRPGSTSEVGPASAPVEAPTSSGARAPRALRGPDAAAPVAARVLSEAVDGGDPAGLRAAIELLTWHGDLSAIAGLARVSDPRLERQARRAIAAIKYRHGGDLRAGELALIEELDPTAGRLSPPAGGELGLAERRDARAEGA